MRKNYHNITLTDEVESFVKKHMEENNIGLSNTLNILILKGIQNIKESNEVSSLSNGIEKVLSRLFYLKVLMEQLYSDFNIDEPSDPKNSIGLKKIQEKVKKSYDE